MARILVTGAAGLLGRPLCDRLVASGHEVVRHARTSAADVNGDLADRDAALAVVAHAAPDVAVNLAALTSVDACEREPVRAYRENAMSVVHLCEALGRDAYLVHMSTDQLYDGPGPHPEEAVRPANVYALSKHAGELAAGAVPSAVLRVNFFGRSRTPGRKSLCDWVIEGLAEGRRLAVFTDVLFNPLSITGLCDQIAHVIERRPTGTYNLGSRGGMSKADFAFAVGEAWGLDTGLLEPAPLDDAALGAYRPRDMRTVVERIERALGCEMPDMRAEIKRVRRESDDVTQH